MTDLKPLLAILTAAAKAGESFTMPAEHLPALLLLVANYKRMEREAAALARSRREAGQKGGAAKSERKTKAVRANGRRAAMTDAEFAAQLALARRVRALRDEGKTRPAIAAELDLTLNRVDVLIRKLPLWLQWES